MQQTPGNRGDRSTRTTPVSSGYAPAGATEFPNFGGDGSVVTNTGYDVEVLGQQPVPNLSYSLARGAPVSTGDIAGPLIEFDVEGDAGASRPSVECRPTAEDCQHVEEDICLIEF